MNSSTISNLNQLEESLQNQAKKAFFDTLKNDLEQNPPKTDQVRSLINELIDALYKFVPSKESIHTQIKEDIYQENINFDTMPTIIYGLISWIEKFQCPVDDAVTAKWRTDFISTPSCSQYIVSFLQEYYEHSERVYRNVWDARQRLVAGDNIIPPEHRPQIKGSNGIPSNIKTGRSGPL